ncbi:MAG TPA: PP2C family protein-serine/threonine phosphatase [Kineosporiaceae bacterium]|nr:PP2C family protein-serine/threonine phosphatase [Kineosporiaceae bacterium]
MHVSLTDAMGHQVPAAQLATLAVAALRQSRRRGATLIEQAHDTNTALTAHAREDQFVTGLLLRIDLDSGAGNLVNAGHPAPYRLRDGLVERLSFAPDPPFGMFPDTTYQVHDLDLLPGDRLLLVTDGMLERNAARLDIPRELTTSPGLHPRETVQHLVRQVGSGGGSQGRRHRALPGLARFPAHPAARQHRRRPRPRLPAGVSGPIHHSPRADPARRSRISGRGSPLTVTGSPCGARNVTVDRVSHAGPPAPGARAGGEAEPDPLAGLAAPGPPRSGQGLHHRQAAAPDVVRCRLMQVGRSGRALVVDGHLDVPVGGHPDDDLVPLPVLDGVGDHLADQEFGHVHDVGRDPGRGQAFTKP